MKCVWVHGPHWFPFNYTDTIDESTQGQQNSPQYRILWDMGHGYAYRWGEYVVGCDVTGDALHLDMDILISGQSGNCYK